jgi:hypothetical protein
MSGISLVGFNIYAGQLKIQLSEVIFTNRPSPIEPTEHLEAKNHGQIRYFAMYMKMTEVLGHFRSLCEGNTSPSTPWHIERMDP